MRDSDTKLLEKQFGKDWKQDLKIVMAKDFFKKWTF